MTEQGKDKSEARRQARKFSRLRDAHASETAEDYVELIDDLIRERGSARIVDLARRFGVAQPTVNKTLGRLQREGLVTRQPYGPVMLTEDGRALAGEARRRHEIVRDFLIALGLDAATADIDAEGIEHHVSPETLALFEAWTARRRKESESGGQGSGP